jgi:hypothetical protein
MLTLLGGCNPKKSVVKKRRNNTEKGGERMEGMFYQVVHSFVKSVIIHLAGYVQRGLMRLPSLHSPTERGARLEIYQPVSFYLPAPFLNSSHHREFTSS